MSFNNMFQYKRNQTKSDLVMAAVSLMISNN